MIISSASSNWKRTDPLMRFSCKPSLPVFSPFAMQCVSSSELTTFFQKNRTIVFYHHYEKKKLSSWICLTQFWMQRLRQCRTRWAFYYLSSNKTEKVVFKCISIFFSQKFLKAKICSTVSCSMDTTQNILTIGTKIWDVLVRIWFYLKIHHCSLSFQSHTKTMPVEPLLEKREWKNIYWPGS